MILESLLAGAVQSGTSVLLTVCGETVSERAGVINLGTEGCMAVGALFAYIVCAETGQPFLAIPVACIAGGLMGLLHAYFVISRKANQLATGLTLMFLGLGLTAFLGRNYVSVSTEGFTKLRIPFLADIPIIGDALFDQDPITYLSYLICAGMCLLLYKTRFGLILRATGEDENVVCAYGADPIRMRYLSVIMGGMLSALGGAQLSIAYTHTWIEGMTGSRGVIGVALVCIAAWNPAKAFIGAYIFGAAQALQMILQQQGLEISSFLLMMIPYVLVLIALFAASIKKNGKMPAELKKVFEAV